MTPSLAAKKPFVSPEVPSSPPLATHLYGNGVLVWIVLSRAFQLGWVKHLPAGKAFATIADLAAALGGIDAVGLSVVRMEGVSTPYYQHTTKTGRLRMELEDMGGVDLSVSRLVRGEEQDVIRVSVDNHKQGHGTEPFVSQRLVRHAEYGRRHVAIVHTALAALTTIERCGLSKRDVQIAVNILMAGAT